MPPELAHQIQPCATQPLTRGEHPGLLGLVREQMPPIYAQRSRCAPSEISAADGHVDELRDLSLELPEVDRAQRAIQLQLAIMDQDRLLVAQQPAEPMDCNLQAIATGVAVRVGPHF